VVGTLAFDGWTVTCTKCNSPPINGQCSVPTSYYSMWHYNCLWILKGQSKSDHFEWQTDRQTTDPRFTPRPPVVNHTSAKLDDVRVLTLICGELSLTSCTRTMTDEWAGRESGTWQTSELVENQALGHSLSLTVDTLNPSASHNTSVSKSTWYFSSTNRFRYPSSLTCNVTFNFI